MRHVETIAIVLIFVMLVLAISSFRNEVFSISVVEITDEIIGVYWDSDCNNRVNSIDWGVLHLGEARQVPVYVRNEWNQSFILVLVPVSWNPKNASRHLIFSWSYEEEIIEAGKIVKVTQTLFVSPSTVGISEFSFDVVFEGRKYLADINCDMTVDIVDLVIVASAYGSTPQDLEWNPFADLNNDLIIDTLDILLVVKDF